MIVESQDQLVKVHLVHLISSPYSETLWLPCQKPRKWGADHPVLVLWRSGRSAAVATTGWVGSALPAHVQSKLWSYEKLCCKTCSCPFYLVHLLIRTVFRCSSSAGSISLAQSHCNRPGFEHWRPRQEPSEPPKEIEIDPCAEQVKGLRINWVN